MRKVLLSVMTAVLGLAGVSNAALCDFGYLDKEGSYTFLYDLSCDGDMLVVSGVISQNGYLTVGEAVDVDLASQTLYSIEIQNGDDDTFDFSLVAFNADGVIESDALTLGEFEDGKLEIQVSGYELYNVGVMISGKNDAFYDVSMYNYVVTNNVPEPLTLSSLALGGLALLRKNRR